MANYATAEDVQVLLGFTDNFSSTTLPTLTQVNSILADVTNEIDFTLASVGVTTQPTDTKLLGRLANACKYGVACQVAMSAYGNASGVENSQGDKYCERYKEVLKDIQENSQLYGAVTGDSGAYASNQVEDGTYTEATVTGRYLNDSYKY
jgi:hypothetical protein